MTSTNPAAFNSGGVECDHYWINNKDMRRALRAWEKKRPNGKPHTIGTPRTKFGALKP